MRGSTQLSRSSLTAAPLLAVRSRRGAAVALLVSVCVLASAATAMATAPPASESLATFEGQLNGHQVSAVTLFTASHTFHVTLTDGHKVRIAFPVSQQQRLVSGIGARGITVKVAKAKSPPPHKLRYIVGGIVIVVIVLCIAGWLLLSRRRQTREEEWGPLSA
jgi:ATP-dependent Zn protease